MCRRLQKVCELLHAFAWAAATVEEVVDHVCDRNFDLEPFVDLVDAGCCEIAFCNHCHFVQGALDCASVADELAKTAVATE